MKKEKYIQWIDIDEAIQMKVGYMYYGDFTAQFAIPHPALTGSHQFYHRAKKITLKNPILRPFRKLGKYFEFGLHDRNTDEVKTVVPFFRFTEDNLRKNKKFKKVKVEGMQYHEKYLQDKKQEAINHNLKFLIDVFSKNNAQKEENIPVWETSKNCKIK